MQILGMLIALQSLALRNAEFEVYIEVHKNSSTANDNEDAPDIESCKRSINFNGLIETLRCNDMTVIKP